MAIWRDPDGFLSRAPVARAVVVKLWRRRDGFFAPPYRRLAKRSSGMAFSGVSPILLVSLTTCIGPLPRCSYRLPLDTQPHSGPWYCGPCPHLFPMRRGDPNSRRNTRPERKLLSPECPHPLGVSPLRPLACPLARSERDRRGTDEEAIK
jgi:hypothetical protein